MRKVSLIILILVGISVFAQKGTEEQLADQFFQSKDYAKAIVYYENLYDKNPSAFYIPYFRCLLAVNDFKRAEKVVKHQLKNSPENLTYYVDLAEAYKADNNINKANEQYNKAIKELVADMSQTLDLGKAFIRVKEYDYAIETFKKGRKYFIRTYPFFNELADVYKAKDDIKSMINEFLDEICYNETTLLDAEMQLQNNLGYDDEKGGFNNPILKQELLKRIQQHPDKIVLYEFLINILIQQKDFEGAFVQSKAIDKRRKEEGYRLMNLGKLCVRNEDFETAQQCYDYVILLGKGNLYYAQACIESSNVQYEKIITQKNYSQADLTEAEKKLKTTLAQFGYNQNTISLVRKLTTLQGFYLSKVQEAIDTLNKVIATPGIDKLSAAELKLDLGDLLLINGEIWDASLLYSQVEKAYKYEGIGEEAKFRNAKIAYYTGDFKWAKAQLDVLKGATSKLIANDAMDLSLLIGDAIGIDTNVVPLQMFASADLLLLQHKTTQGLQRMDSINILFDNHSLADDIYYKKGMVFAKQGKYKEALEAYQRVVDAYGEDIYGDDALFKMAEIYQYNLKDIEKAKALYQDLITKYPASIYTVEARKRFRKLRGDVVN